MSDIKQALELLEDKVQQVERGKKVTVDERLSLIGEFTDLQISIQDEYTKELEKVNSLFIRLDSVQEVTKD